MAVPEQAAPAAQPGTLTIEGGGTSLRFAGTLDVAATARLWADVQRAARAGAKQSLIIDLTAVTMCDTSGATMVLAAERAHGGTVSIQGADERVAAVLDLVRPVAGPKPPRGRGPAQTWREVFASGLNVCTGGLAYLGEVVLAIIRLPARRRMFRMADVLRACGIRTPAQGANYVCFR